MDNPLIETKEEPMSERPIFNSTEQAVTVNFHMVQRLSMVVSWCLVWLSQLTLAVLIAALMWWHQVTPEAVVQTLLAWLESRTGLVLGAVGLSAAAVTTGYVALLKWVRQNPLSSWLIRYMLQDA